MVIHILRGGITLCVMQGLPCDWPEGHRWTGVGDAGKATCEECLRKLKLEDQEKKSRMVDQARRKP